MYILQLLCTVKQYIHTSRYRLMRGFTLFELAVSVGVIAILSGLVYVTVQPSELLARARDAQRVSDMNEIAALIAKKNMQEKRIKNLGIPNTIYISIPSTNENCSDITSQLLPLPTGYTYHCVTAGNLRNVNGTGWIPIDFTSDKLSSLPIDPVNSAAGGLYYAYIYDGSNFELNTSIESTKGTDEFASKDGGTAPGVYETGSLSTLYDESIITPGLVDGSSCTQNSDCQNTSCVTLYTDADYDTYGIGSSLGSFCYLTSSIPAGKSLNTNDCDDSSGSIVPGSTRTRYNTLSVSCGTACASETQTCSAGVWSGTYTSASCTASTRTAYQTASVCGTSCTSETQSCQTNGSWTGTYTYTSCSQTSGTTWYRDADNDGSGTSGTTTTACTQPSGYVANANDCDDANASIYQGSTRTRYSSASVSCGGSCINETQTCSGGSWTGTYAYSSCTVASGTTWYRDADGDGYGISGTTTTACTQPSGYVANSGSWDCNDASSSIYPGTTRTMYASDSVACGSSCSTVAETQTCLSSGSWNGSNTYSSCEPIGQSIWYRDVDGDGYPVGTTYTYACTQPSGYVANSGSWDCNDASSSIYPGTSRTQYSATSVSCSSSCSSVAEIQTCQSSGGWSGSPVYYQYTTCSVASGTTYYRDLDGDGYGNPSVTTVYCGSAPAGYVANNTDCNDSYATINPGATYQTAARPDTGTYDWNCDGSITKYYTSGQVTTCEGGTACSGYSIYWYDGSSCSYDSYRSSTNCISSGATVNYADQACGTVLYYGDFSSSYAVGSRVDSSCTTYNPTLYFCTSFQQTCK